MGFWLCHKTDLKGQRFYDIEIIKTNKMGKSNNLK